MASAPDPSPFKFGYYYDEEKEEADRREPQLYDGERHILLFGVNGAGKSTRILIENLITIRNRSLVIFDMKGELAAQTIRTRRALGDVKLINPYNLFDLGSDGYNPLALLDPSDDLFYDQAKFIAVSIIDVDGEGNRFFPESAQGWFCAGIMWEVMLARYNKRQPSLLRARQLCLQPDEFQENEEGKKILTAGVTINAGLMLKSRGRMAGGDQLAELAGMFAKPELGRSDRDILSTLGVQTQFLISPPIARDLEKGSWDFAQLKERPTAVYVVLPPEQVEDKRKWTRVLITCALCAHLRPGPVKTLFVLDEFRVSIGHLQIVNNFWALVRGYGVQFMPVCQSVLQLQALFKTEWENYAGQAGVVVTIGPPGDMVTAEWMSRRSGNKTIWQEGYSEGQNQGGQGSSTTWGGSLGQVERAFMLPQDIMSMKLGTGRIWPAGHGDISIPFFAPNYWQRRELRGLVDDNPYRTGAASAPKAAAPSPAPAAPVRLSWQYETFMWSWEHCPVGVLRFLLRIDPKLTQHLKSISMALARAHLRKQDERRRIANRSLTWKILTSLLGLALIPLVLFMYWKADQSFGFPVLKAVRPWAAEYAPSLLVYFPPETDPFRQLRGLGHAIEPPARKPSR